MIHHPISISPACDVDAHALVDGSNLHQIRTVTHHPLAQQIEQHGYTIVALRDLARGEELFYSYTGVEGVAGTNTALVVNYGFSVPDNEHRDFAECVQTGRTLWSPSHGAEFDPAHFDAPRGPWSFEPAR